MLDKQIAKTKKKLKKLKNFILKKVTILIKKSFKKEL
jgi:hypothetical protein